MTLSRIAKTDNLRQIQSNKTSKAAKAIDPCVMTSPQNSLCDMARPGAIVAASEEGA